MLSVAGGLGDQPGPAQGVGQRAFRGGVAPAAPLAAAPAPALARPGTAPAPAVVLVLRRTALATLALAALAAASLAGPRPVGDVVVQPQGE
jgi:hypothetical protein